MSARAEVQLAPSKALPRARSVVPAALRWRRAALAAAFGAVLTPYLIALWSPLRLSADSVVYLSLANGIRPPAGSQQYPPGFPELLRLAEGVGLGSAWGFVAMNLVLLAVAVGAFYRLCRGSMRLGASAAALMCLALLLSNQVSELTPIVLSDVPYLAAAMVCLLALSEAEQRSGWARARLLLLGAVVAAIAIALRTEALALVPPVLFVAVGKENLLSLWRVAKRRWAIALAVAVPSSLALIAVVVLVVKATAYARPIAHTWGPHGAYLHALRSRVFSLATLATQGHCCQYLMHKSIILPVLGALALLVTVGLGWLARRRFGAVELFVLSTAATILVYGAQPRFWIAALPFMIVYAWFGLEQLARFKVAKIAIVAYLAAYVIVGGAWLIQSIQFTTSGRAFPRVWAKQLNMAPPLADAYLVAFGQGGPAAERVALPAAVELLRRYGR